MHGHARDHGVPPAGARGPGLHRRRRDRPVRQPEHVLHRGLAPAEGAAARQRRRRRHREPGPALRGDHAAGEAPLPRARGLHHLARLRRRPGLARARRAHGRRARRGGHHAGGLPLRPRDLRDVPGLLSSRAERGQRPGRHRVRPPRPRPTWGRRRRRPPRSSPSSASATPPASGPAERDHGRSRRPGGPTVAHVGHPGPHLPHRLPAPRGARRDRQGAHAGVRHHRHRGGPALRDVLLLLRGLHGPGRGAHRQRRPAVGDRGRRRGHGPGLAGHGPRRRAPPSSSPAACWWAWARR